MDRSIRCVCARARSLLHRCM